MDLDDSTTSDFTHEEAEHDSILDGVIVEEMGEAMAGVMRRLRRTQEARFRREHPDEGLRDRKRRLTRQLISDAATTMFATRGFDEVRVSEVAERVGVSEKTIYNYFPTKESLVLDDADEIVEELATALRDRPPGASLTDAVVHALESDMARLDSEGDVLDEIVPAFVEMLEHTPSLHAAWLELHARLARVATEELAAQAGVDPRDPEPMIAGRALVGLVDARMQSWMRHTQDGLRGQTLRDAVAGDVRRAARLLETGLWSFNLPASQRARSQAMEAARAAEEARRQVVGALREARAAWDDARRQARAAGEQARAAGEQARAAGEDARRQARKAGEDARRQARKAGEDAREAGRSAGREAHEAAHRAREEARRSRRSPS